MSTASAMEQKLRLVEVGCRLEQALHVRVMQRFPSVGLAVFDLVAVIRACSLRHT